jgi:predicted CoA-binding protein
MITKDDTIAIVGASNNTEKYGHIVMKDLLVKGYDVIPINPKEKTILNKKVYKSIKDVSEKIDAVIFVVPPKVVEDVIQDVKILGIKDVWMQPGSESQKAIEYCEENGIECIHNACVMMQ